MPEKGWTLLSADYSQIELRLLAHCSNDEILIKAFEDDEDIHRRTAAEVFQVTSEDVSMELRRQAKVINFGIIYGMGAFSLAKELGITQKMAATYIENYFTRYRGVKQFIDETIQQSGQPIKPKPFWDGFACFRKSTVAITMYVPLPNEQRSIPRFRVARRT